MVCQNCKSKDVIAIQDQHFCVNCGQMATGEFTTDMNTEDDVVIDPKKKWAPKLKRGRPKAGRLDEPRIVLDSAPMRTPMMPDGPRIGRSRAMSDLVLVTKNELSEETQLVAVDQNLSYAHVIGASLHDRIDLPYLGWS